MTAKAWRGANYRVAALLVLFAISCHRDPQSTTPSDAGALKFRPGIALAASTTAPADAWDVQHPPGPRQTLDIDVREGTWISVDVSPDGSRVAFDLLGDIYEIPIAGGDAIAVTEGVAWDMQPRYSPDGRSIAFTSDRGGGDNVWVIDTDGSNARAITEETFRLVGAPAWSPDGQFIAVRKHFTAERSLGAGEIWLYHITGGKGLQVTEKPTDQKDVGEPAFSGDGRWLYFSQDDTPGKTFEYNKDPHAGIYTIFRVDRSDGRIERFLGGPGGAVRPTPSPDGKTLAFVRRVGTKTVLFVHDLSSGAERPIWDGLDRDMQETWAIHGVYPAMAWTPDSRSLVLWAAGKLHRIDPASGARAEIPFHVSSSRTVQPAVRFPVSVHPQTFHTRMLRWASVAPDGKSVVFQALGHLYIRALPDGQPRRLVRDGDDDVFEFYPAWSRDSSAIVYTTWSDDNLGTVRVVARSGARARVLSDRPGHYVEPAFSPDGRTVVYRRTAGGNLRSQRWSRDTGLYRVPTSGGENVLVYRGGRDPRFAAANDRFFFGESDTDDSDTHTTRVQLLRSVELDGSDVRTHLRSKTVTDFVVSPDAHYVAFRDLYNAYVAPFPAAGKPFDLDNKTESIPVRRVSRDAGEAIHFSGDGKRLWWSLGPELFGLDLEHAFSTPAETDEKTSGRPLPAADVLDIGFDAESYTTKGAIALVGGTIVPMNDDRVIADGVLVIDGDRIRALGTRAEVTIPAGVRQVDVSGMTVIPGLVDVHAHGPQGGEGITPQRNWLHYATLAFGVTTVHDPSNDTGEIFAAAELARAGLVVAPRIFSTGTILYGAETPFLAVVESLEDARTHLRRMKAVGAFSVKSYNQPRRSQRQQILAAARELGMMVVPEGGSLFQHDMTMVVDGHTGLEHALPVAAIYDDVEQLWGRTEVGYTPTLVVGYGGLWGENYWYAKTNVFQHERLRRFVPPFAYEPASRRRVLASDGDWNHIAIARGARQLADKGVSIQLGAHGQREGLAAHWELWMFVQGGMTPHQALQAGTIAGARYLGLDGDLGSLEVGKLADIAVVEGDPLSDIRVSDRVRYTIAGGRLFDARTMQQVSPDETAPPVFFWQKSGG